MQLRIELPGYGRASQRLRVDRVSAEVIGPAEARRALGPALADTLALAGPVVLVEASLPSAEFIVEGERFAYHEGMPARAEVRTDERTLLELLLPGTRGRGEPSGRGQEMAR